VLEFPVQLLHTVAPAPTQEPIEQFAQATVEAALYSPAAQAVHEEAAAFANVFVKEPGWQTVHIVEPVLLVNRPAAHALHAVTFDSTLYRPAAQGVHMVAPTAMPVLVMFPAAHALHAVTFDSTLYRPAEHGVHMVAPTAMPVLVMFPAPQTLHATVGTAE
jgi:hypothetical protein